MKIRDEYADWAASYGKAEALTRIYPTEKTFLQKVFDKYQVKSALDCACGTGPHLRLLARICPLSRAGRPIAKRCETRLPRPCTPTTASF